MRLKPQEEADLLFYKASRLEDENQRLRAIILDIARIVENPDDRALQRVRDVTDKESEASDSKTPKDTP